MAYSPIVNPMPVSAASLPLPAGAALDATLTGGTSKAIARGGAKGSTTAADVTSVSIDANTQALHTNVTNFPASQAVTGTFWQATQPVSLATNTPVIATGSNVIGALTANQSVNQTQINGVAVLAGNGVTGTGSMRVTIASDQTAFSVNATGPTLTKGTQGATGHSVQDLKDAGRSCLAMTAEFAFAQTAETLLTMTLSTDGAATTTFSSRVITSGKKFRIQSVHIEVETLGSGTAPQRAYLRLRRNNAGATVAGSPLQAVWCCVNNTAIVKSAAFMDYEYPDGMEMNGDGTATFGFTLETPDWVTTTGTGRAKITVIGYEY